MQNIINTNTNVEVHVRRGNGNIFKVTGQWKLHTSIRELREAISRSLNLNPQYFSLHMNRANQLEPLAGSITLSRVPGISNNKGGPKIIEIVCREMVTVIYPIIINDRVFKYDSKIINPSATLFQVLQQIRVDTKKYPLVEITYNRTGKTERINLLKNDRRRNMSFARLFASVLFQGTGHPTFAINFQSIA